MRNNEPLPERSDLDKPRVSRAARAAGSVALAMPILMTALALGSQPDTERLTWLTGASLDRQLETPVAMLRWSSNPLRGALSSLARSQRIAILMDRRVDPDQTVEFSVQDRPVQEVIQQLARSLQLGVCRVGPVVYVGPPETAAVLATIVELRREALRQWPSTLASRLREPRPIAWPELAEPRQLIETAAHQAGIAVDGLDQIPHDLWPAVDLPPVDFAESMTLLLAGFGLTFELAEGEPRIRLVPLPASAALERTHRLSSRQAERLAELLRERYPGVLCERKADGLFVRGPIELHQTVERWIRGESAPSTTRKPAPGEAVRYTLKVENQPVGAIAKALAERLGLQIQYDPQSLVKLDQRVSFHVEQATQDELLRALLEPAGLDYQITGMTLTVRPAARTP